MKKIIIMLAILNFSGCETTRQFVWYPTFFIGGIFAGCCTEISGPNYHSSLICFDNDKNEEHYEIRKAANFLQDKKQSCYIEVCNHRHEDCKGF